MKRKSITGCALFLLATVMVLTLESCTATKEEAQYAARNPIPTSAGTDVLLTITQERFQAPATKVEGAPEAPVAVRSWNTAEMKKYKVGINDRLKVTVFYGEKDTNQLESIVQNDGKITLPLFGQVEVLDKTPEEIQEIIKEKSKTFFVEPSVSVAVSEFNAHKAYVIGRGVKGSEILLKKRTTLVEVITGGSYFTLDGVDLKGAYLRRGQKIYPIDLDALLKGDLSYNYELVDDDIIYLRALKETRVFILGEVSKPGVYDMEIDDNLFSLMARAGGPTPSSQLHEVRIIRGGISNPLLITVDIAPIFQRKTPRNLNVDDLRALKISVDASRRNTLALETLYLQNEDFVFVPKTALARWNDIIGQITPTLSFILGQPVMVLSSAVLVKSALGK